MKHFRISTFFFMSLITMSLFSKDYVYDKSVQAWDETYPAIQARIVAPTFKNADYPITSFGAVANNEKYLNTASINAAINKCNFDGGGRVIVPKGTWYTGPITLKSNVNLFLEDGAVLLFTADVSQYPLALTRWEGIDCYNYQPQVYAYGETNIAITGKGTLDGGATKDNWWSRTGFGFEENKESQSLGRPLLQKWNESKLSVAKRIMGRGFGMRVQMVNFFKCKNILIEDVTLLRSPFWVIHPLLSENITVRGIHVFNDGPNGDGCDPESCKDVLIENCRFHTGDDCIAIKSGRNEDGRRWNVPSENIIVRNCEMEDGHGGVVVGSEITGGFNNLFVENCKMDSPNLDRVIRIKTNMCRGGMIENVYVRNIEVGQCKESVLKINMNYDTRETSNRGYMPTVRNVFLNNVNCKKSTYGVFIDALKDQYNVENIQLKKCRFEGVEKDCNLIRGKVRGAYFNDLKINKKKAKTVYM